MVLSEGKKSGREITKERPAEDPKKKESVVAQSHYTPKKTKPQL
jgi:hypothetical protein